MTADQILTLSRSKYETGLHRTATLAHKARLSLGEAYLLLKSVADLTELNACRFASAGYQNELLK